MLYLLLAIASSALISIIMRLSEHYVKNEMGMFMANYAVCMVLSYLYMPDKAFLPVMAEPGNGFTWMLGIISGILYLASFVFMKKNMVKNGIVMTSTFMKLGVLVPTLMAVVIFREMPRGTQVVGFVLAVLGILGMYLERQTTNHDFNKVWLLLLLFLSGLTDAMANIFDELGNKSFKDMYLLITFAIALLIAAALTFRGGARVACKDLMVGVLIGIPNYYSARFLLKALGEIPAVVAYPTFSIGTIAVITLTGVVAFKEKLTIRQMFAVGLIAVAVVLLN